MALDFLTSLVVPLGLAGVLAAAAVNAYGKLPATTAPPVAPSAVTREPSLDKVITRIKSQVLERHPVTDPLVGKPGEIRVKMSNRDGVRIDGVRYFYRLTHRTSADPVSRGQARSPVVVTVLYPGSPWEIVVYRLQ